MDEIEYAALAATAPEGLGLAYAIAKAAQAVSCPIYKVAPGFFTTEADTQLPGFSQLPAKAIMDAACGSAGQPLPGPLPGPQFSGGQCPIFYNVHVAGQWHAANGDSGYAGGVPAGEDATVLGPVYGIQIRNGAVQLASSNGQGGISYLAVGGESTSPVVSSDIAITSIVPANAGQPDNCGNPPDGFPINRPTPPQLSGNTAINDPSGGAPVPVPYTVIGPDPGGGITVNIGGATVNFGPIGVKISPQVGLPGGGTGGSSGGLTPQQAAQLADAASGRGNAPGGQKPPSPATHNKTSNPPAPGGKKDSLPGLSYVELDVTIGYNNIDRQAGSQPPDVLYRVGWLWFTIDGHYASRQPIDTYAKIYTAPAGSDGYVYSLLPGASAIATEYVLKETTSGN